MGDPVGIAKHAKTQLNPGGSVMLVEPFAFDSREENHAGLGGLTYGASTFFCAPCSFTSTDVLPSPSRKRTAPCDGGVGYRRYRGLSVRVVRVAPRTRTCRSPVGFRCLDHPTVRISNLGFANAYARVAELRVSFRECAAQTAVL